MADLKAAVGSLTILDLNKPEAKYYWQGAELLYVLSVMAYSKPPAPKRVAIRVVNPQSQTELTPEKRQELETIYNEMSASGIVLMRVG